MRAEPLLADFATDPPTVAPSPLVAVRTAGATFGGPFDLRSEALIEAIATHAALVEARAAQADRVGDLLYAAVPGATPARRRRLLAAKRSVFNGRPMAPFADDPALEPERDALAELARLDAQIAATEGTEATCQFVAEARERLWALLEDADFADACAYSSPELWEAATRERPEDRPAESFTKVERKLAGYAAKRISKANPFHRFASMAFPADAGLPVLRSEEVLPDADRLLYGEIGRLLAARRAGEPVPEGTTACLRPYTVDGEQVVFLVPRLDGGDALRVGLSDGPVLDRVLDRFPPGGGPLRPGRDLIESPEEARVMDQLLRVGVIGEFIAPSHPDSAVRAVWGGAVEGAKADGSAAAAYLNTYAPSDWADAHRALAESIAPTLEALAPYFVAHNNEAFAEAADGFFRDGVVDGPTPLTALLGVALADAEAFQRDRVDPAHRAAYARQQEAEATFSTLSGALALGDLPPPPERRPTTQSLCFNGPADAETGAFYVTNVWTGHGRFTHRYRPGVRRPLRMPLSDDAVDVQLVGPFSQNRNLVGAVLPVGFGLDGRHRSAFEEWIEPADVQVEPSAFGVAFVHRPTGRRLRFHHLGSALLSSLPLELRLLAGASGDFFASPFSAYAHPDEDATFVPGLSVGPVYLRRPRWSYRRSALSFDGAEGAAWWIRVADRLRQDAEAQGETGDLTRWYVRLSADRGRYAHKPRFVDVGDPLSVERLRRGIERLPADGVAAFTRMAPGPEALLSRDGRPILTEIMIEP